MFPMSKRWMMVAAIGYGMLFSVALIGGVRIVCLLLGMTLSDCLAGNLILVSSVMTGTLSGYLFSRSPLADPD